MTGHPHKYFRLVFVLSLMGLLTACNQGVGDLRTFVQQIKAQPPGRIEPIPEFQPYQNFEYTSHDLRDPF
ncbi:MAG: pilus assembly protein PilP, partial [Gammaproteobacteria bacterium]